MNTIELLDTVTFAAKAHSGQIDKQGNPYIVHLLDVARRVAVMSDHPDYVTTALLHDTLEDTGVTRLELDRKFGRRISLAVVCVTRNNRESYDGYIAGIVASDNMLAQMVKVADLQSNLDRIPADPSPATAMMWVRLKKRYTAALAVIEAALSDKTLI